MEPNPVAPDAARSPRARKTAWVVAGLALATAAIGGALWAAATPPAAAPQPSAAASTAAGPRTVKVDTIVAANGPMPTIEDIVLINYKGTLPDGKVFDQAQRAVFPVSEVVPGFTQGLIQMHKGGTYRLFIPSDLGYGARGAGPIPPNTDLSFEVELVDFKTPAEIAQMRAAQAAKPAER